MKDSYLSIFLLFLRFGLLAWGGPVAQIGMIRDELVERRGWITPEKFRRTLAVYQALPGPEAHELCVYFGMIRAGRWGGFLAGLGFMLPGLLLMLLLAWGYQYYGAAVLLPLFVGVAPAVTAMIVRAAHRIGQQVLVDTSHWLAALAAVVLTLLGVHFLLVFFVCATWQAFWSAGKRRAAVIAGIILTATALIIGLMFSVSSIISTGGTGNLLVEGLKAGLLSFGGAYTAIPFLQSSMVGHYPAITQQVFLDGIALGSVIPAPLIIFGTFLGFVADGLMGALLMTLGIFAPAFAFTLLGHNQLERVIENRMLHGALDGISVAVVGLLAITALQIFQNVITGWQQVALFATALAAFYLIKSKWVIPAVIVVSGIVGFLLN
ncbi:MAG: chromate efflux transporter [Alphaproteobacteria bacterium]|nr:chromate efflux transporter [Alphaproteobacteria bacterium]